MRTVPAFCYTVLGCIILGERQMSENTKPNKPLDIPEDLQEEAANTIKQAFQLFSDHNAQIAKELREFNANRQDVRKRLQSGANRTTGRIV